MTVWLSRQEAIETRNEYIRWLESEEAREIENEQMVVDAQEVELRSARDSGTEDPRNAAPLIGQLP